MMWHPPDAVDCLGKHCHIFVWQHAPVFCFQLYDSLLLLLLLLQKREYSLIKNNVVIKKCRSDGRMIGGWWSWCCDRLVRAAGLRSNWKRLLLCSRKWLRRRGQRTSDSRVLRLLHQPTSWRLCRQKIVNSRCDSKYSFCFVTDFHLGSAPYLF